MFLLTNKALIRVGKGQKRKAPESSRLGAVWESYGIRDVHQELADQASQNGTKAEFFLQE